MTMTSDTTSAASGLARGVPLRTLSNLLVKAMRDHSEREALVEGDIRLTYGDLYQRVTAIGHWLRGQGLTHESRVGVVSRNSIGFATAIVAVEVNGFAGVWITSRLSPAEVRYNSDKAGVEVLFVDDDWARKIDDVYGKDDARPIIVCLNSDTAPKGVTTLDEVLVQGDIAEQSEGVEPDADSISLITFTSGTTGKPKGAVLTQSALYNMVRHWTMSFPDLDGRERVLHSAPLGHFSQVIMYSSLTKGGAQHILGKFDAGTLLDTIAREQIEVLPLVPTQISAAVEEQLARPRDVSTLVSIPYSGSPISPDRLRKAVQAFGPVFCQSYAQSEVMPPIAVLSKDDHRIALELGADGMRILASAGRPVPFVDVKIVDLTGNECARGEIGEITVRSDTAMREYWMDHAATEEAFNDGWLRTGDMGKLSEDGFLTIADRRKSMIISGGFNVYPVEVENAIYELSWVREAAVIGIPDEKWGEAVIAAVSIDREQAADMDHDALSAELIASCRTRIADYKVPKKVVFMDELPKSATGKIQSRLIRDPYWVGRERRVV